MVWFRSVDKYCARWKQSVARHACAIVWCVAMSCGGATVRSPCPSLISNHQTFAELVCYVEFARGGDPTIGTLAARGLADARSGRDLVTAIAHQVGDSATGAEAWNALGDVLRRAHEDQASIEAYRRALDHRATGDLKGRIHDAVGLYTQYHRTDDFLLAMQYVALAYDLSRQLGDRRERAYVLPGIANIAFDMGDLPLAKTLVDEADTVIDKESEFWPYLLVLHGNIDAERGRYQLAEEELSHAIEEARRQPALASVVRNATFSKAWTQVRAGAPDAAARTLSTLAIDPADADSSARYAVMASRVALERGRADEAIAIAHSVPGAPPNWVVWLDAAMGRALARVGRNVEAEAALVRSIARLEGERADLEIDSLKPWVLASQREPFEILFRLYAEQGRAADALAVVQRAMARSLLDRLVEQSATSAPAVAAQLVREGRRFVGLRAIAQSISASQAVGAPTAVDLATRLAAHHVITYFRAGDELWLVSLRGGQASVQRVGRVDELSARISAWKAATDRAALAESLAATLLPVVMLPPAGETIYLAIDEPLRDVAFAALRIGGTYVFERNPIAYIPSASVLAAQLGRRHDGVGVAVLGDPGGNLPAARAEAREIAQILGVQPRVGTSATRAAVLAAGGGQLLHFAGHSEITPTGAALRLADGVLGAGELIDTGRAARVVVLTSCSSADPLDRDELGPLAIAFLAAGAETVVASRWAVEDAGAALFARAFYAAGGAEHPIRAVAAAQRELVARGVSEAIWSSFVVVGAATSPLS